MFLCKCNILVLFVILLPIITHAVEEAPDVRYQRAVELKKAGTEESLMQAEALFLELSGVEHDSQAKARHNYAMIQYKKENYRSAYEYFLRAGLDASMKNAKKIRDDGLLKEDLYLVIGSDRGSTIEGCESHKNIAHIVYGTDCDTSPLRVFGEKATTMDINESSEANARHIVGDAVTFDFSKRYNIKHVLMERFPTSSRAALEGREPMTKNYAGFCIQQLSKAMKPGAILEYEWDPFLEALGSVDEIDRSVRKNPFTGFFDFSEIFEDVRNLYRNTNAETGSCGQIRRHLTFFNNVGLGRDLSQLIERLYWEVDISSAICDGRKQVFIPCELGVSRSEDLTTDPTAEFIEAAKFAEYGNFLQQVGKKVKKNGRAGIVYDVNTFVVRTYLNFIMVQMAAEHNVPFVKEYMETNGFRDVSVERRGNPHNGRNNVWMVYAVKA